MYPTPDDRPGNGSYGRPNFNAPAVQARKTGTMLNAEGQTVAISIPKVVNMQFTNVSRPTDSFVMAISYDGSKTPAAVLARTGNAHRYRWLLPPNAQSGNYSAQELAKTRILGLVNNLAEVKADPDGAKMWQDKANNLVWIKVVGNLAANNDWYRIENFTAPFGQDLYQEMSLYLRDANTPSQ